MGVSLVTQLPLFTTPSPPPNPAPPLTVRYFFAALEGFRLGWAGGAWAPTEEGARFKLGQWLRDNVDLLYAWQRAGMNVSEVK